MKSVPREEDVLDAFAAEPSHDAATFKRYLKDYPQYAEALVDLSRELSREIGQDEPLSKREIAWIKEDGRNSGPPHALTPQSSKSAVRKSPILST